MSSRVRARLVCAALLWSVHPALAGPLELTLQTSVARARQRAPQAIAAIERTHEARARGEGARVVLTENPEIEIGVGRRSGADTLAVSGQLTQPLELGKRGARIDVADAELGSAIATKDATLRELDDAVATAFYEALFADAAIALAERDVELARRAAEAAERRRKAGDITDLAVGLAKIAHGRARAALAAAQATRAAVVGRLGALVGARPEDTITLAGPLEPEALTLATLQPQVAKRADVRALAWEVRTGEAEHALARRSAWPALGVWFGYERDEGDTVLLGGLSLTLPMWNRGQGESALARAKVRRAALEGRAIVEAASRELVDAHAAYVRAREAVEIFRQDVLPVLADSEQLLEKSIESGQIAIDTYLVARQEILAGRREGLERQLALAQAALHARFVAGVAP